jgi:hypothetical protein
VVAVTRATAVVVGVLVAVAKMGRNGVVVHGDLVEPALTVDVANRDLVVAVVVPAVA